MIERFILPKRLPNPAQLSICISCGNTLEASHDSPESHTRFQKCVHVIWHDDPSMQTVLPELCATKESITNISSDRTVQKPQWAALRAIEPPIERKKSLAGGIPRTLYSSHDRAWKRANQSPSNENTFSRRMPVRQVPFIVGHFAGGPCFAVETWGFFLSYCVNLRAPSIFLLGKLDFRPPPPPPFETPVFEIYNRSVKSLQVANLMIKCIVTLEHQSLFRQPTAPSAHHYASPVSRANCQISFFDSTNRSSHFAPNRASQLLCFHIHTNCSQNILFALISLQKHRGVGVKLHHNCAIFKPLPAFKNNPAEKWSRPPAPFAVSLSPPLPVEYTGHAKGEVRGQVHERARP